eukprot:5869245-Pyramimonas_sp.AAC.1
MALWLTLEETIFEIVAFIRNVEPRSSKTRSRGGPAGAGALSPLQNTVGLQGPTWPKRPAVPMA